MKIARQMGILTFLIEGKKATAQQLAEMFEVSSRTIMRDIGDLTVAGIPLYTQLGKNGGIFLTENYQQDKPPLTIEEMHSIKNSLDARYQVLGDDVTFYALLKLNSSPDNGDFEIDLSLSQGNIELRTTIFQLLQFIKSTTAISFQYTNTVGQTSTKKCEPYRIVFKQQSWYLDAYDLEKDSFRVYKVARMNNIASLHQFDKRTFTPPGFQGGEWMTAGTIPVQLSVNERVIDQFIERLGMNAIINNNDGTYQVEYPLKDNEWSYNLLLGYGNHLQVLAPEAFKKNFEVHLQKIVTLYHQ